MCLFQLVPLDLQDNNSLARHSVTTHPDIRLRKAALDVYLVSAQMFHEVYIQYILWFAILINANISLFTFKNPPLKGLKEEI